MPKAALKKSAAASKPGKAASPMTVTLKQMATELAEKHDLSKEQKQAVLADLVTLATHRPEEERAAADGRSRHPAGPRLGPWYRTQPGHRRSHQNRRRLRRSPSARSRS